MTNAQSRPLRDACIYIILSPKHNLCYYGSTFDTLKKRFTKHKSMSSKCTSKQIINAGNAKIFELEYYPCHTKEQLEDREAHFIITDWDGCVNECVPGAVRRAGGQVAYDKIKDAKPEVKARHKAYDAKPEVKARKKAYNAKPEVKAKAKEKIACNICGCFIRRDGKSEHQKTKKCQKFIQTEQLDQ